jgi:hypothetical protein
VSYTFRVIFSGVCAYVPDKPFFVQEKRENEEAGRTEQERGVRGQDLEALDEDQSDQWMRRSDAIDTEPDSGPIRSLAVLLPDLRRPGKPSLPPEMELNFPSFRAPHFPLLKFDLGDLREGTTRRVDLVGRDISEKNEKGLLFLRREQIRFNLKAENATAFSFAGWAPYPVDQNNQDKLPDCCRELGRLPEWWGKEPDLGDREQLESLWWLPDLERIVPGNREAAKVKSDVLPSYRGPFPPELVARVECQGGRLRTYDFNRSADGIPVRWRFAKPSARQQETGTWNRALANSLALEFFDVRSEVRIELRRLANEVVVEELVLAPAPGASRPVLEISISNREPDLLFQEESFSRSTLPDLDFQPFYELSQADPLDFSKLPIPHAARHSLFGVVEKPCTGGGMRG